MADDVPGSDRPVASIELPSMPSRPPQRQAPGPLLAAMGTLIAVFLIAAWLTGEWVFLVLGVFGFAAGLVPFISKK